MGLGQQDGGNSTRRERKGEREGEKNHAVFRLDHHFSRWRRIYLTPVQSAWAAHVETVWGWR